jgi:hypothetical protein
MMINYTHQLFKGIIMQRKITLNQTVTPTPKSRSEYIIDSSRIAAHHKYMIKMIDTIELDDETGKLSYKNTFIFHDITRKIIKHYPGVSLSKLYKEYVDANAQAGRASLYITDSGSRISPTDIAAIANTINIAGKQHGFVIRTLALEGRSIKVDKILSYFPNVDLLILNDIGSEDYISALNDKLANNPGFKILYGSDNSHSNLNTAIAKLNHPRCKPFTVNLDTANNKRKRTSSGESSSDASVRVDEQQALVNVQTNPKNKIAKKDKQAAASSSAATPDVADTSHANTDGGAISTQDQDAALALTLFENAIERVDLATLNNMMALLNDHISKVKPLQLLPPPQPDDNGCCPYYVLSTVVVGARFGIVMKLKAQLAKKIDLLSSLAATSTAHFYDGDLDSLPNQSNDAMVVDSVQIDDKVATALELFKQLVAKNSTAANALLKKTVNQRFAEGQTVLASQPVATEQVNNNDAQPVLWTLDSPVYQSYPAATSPLMTTGLFGHFPYAESIPQLDLAEDFSPLTPTL